MRRILHSYLAIALSLMLVFTGQSLAVARGMPGPSGQMVICTGQGPVMISVDADGNPAGAPHICPDGALALIQTGFDAPLEADPQGLHARVPYGTQSVDQAGLLTATPQARGPPTHA